MWNPMQKTIWILKTILNQEDPKLSMKFTVNHSKLSSPSYWVKATLLPLRPLIDLFLYSHF